MINLVIVTASGEKKTNGSHDMICVPICGRWVSGQSYVQYAYCASTIPLKLQKKIKQRTETKERKTKERSRSCMHEDSEGCTPVISANKPVTAVMQ